MTEPQFLIVMRLANMRVLHPQQDNSRTCSRCAEAVGIYPSGQRILAQFPTTALLCEVCYKRTPDDRLYLAPGAVEEFGQGKPRQ